MTELVESSIDSSGRYVEKDGSMILEAGNADAAKRVGWLLSDIARAVGGESPESYRPAGNLCGRIDSCVPELKPMDGDTVLYKARDSGFYGTSLDEVLRAGGIQQLIVVGATTSVCVESTVRDAMFRDYHCLVIADAMAEPIAADAVRSNHEASLLTLELLFASVTESADLIASLRAAAVVPT